MPAHLETASIRRSVILGTFAVSGAAALSYEVVWTRALSVVLGSTTYAVATMLATFMFGLAVGGILGGRLADRRNPLALFAFAELGIGGLGIASHAVIEALPALHLAAYRAFHLGASSYFAGQVGLCALVMFAPTVLMGTTFPLVTRALTPTVEEVGRVVGLAYGVNTLGAVVGSIATGFVFVPELGLRGATLVAAGLNASVALMVLLRAGSRRTGVAALLALAYVPLAAALLNAERRWTNVNFFTAHRVSRGYADAVTSDQAHMRKVFERDGADGYVAAYQLRTGHLLLQVGGRIEGTGAEDMNNTLLLAALPVAAHRAPRSVLVIGLGAGVTLEEARRQAPEAEVAEISDGVIEAVRRFGPPGVLEGVLVHRDDARHLLLMEGRRWDVITSEPSYPAEYAVANLFSLEFYRMAARRLAHGGVFCQWLPYYMLTNDDVTMMVKTFGLAFPYVSLWKVPGSMDLLLLGSAGPFARSPEEILARVRARTTGPLDVVLSRTPEQVREVVARPEVPVNTDDHPRLEFVIARNFRIGDLSLIER